MLNLLKKVEFLKLATTMKLRVCIRRLLISIKLLTTIVVVQFFNPKTRLILLAISSEDEIRSELVFYNYLGGVPKVYKNRKY